MNNWVSNEIDELRRQRDDERDQLRTRVTELEELLVQLGERYEKSSQALRDAAAAAQEVRWKATSSLRSAQGEADGLRAELTGLRSRLVQEHHKDRQGWDQERQGLLERLEALEASGLRSIEAFTSMSHNRDYWQKLTCQRESDLIDAESKLEEVQAKLTSETAAAAEEAYERGRDEAEDAYYHKGKGDTLNRIARELDMNRPPMPGDYLHELCQVLKNQWAAERLGRLKSMFAKDRFTD